MNNSNFEYRIKALKILASEFSNKKYGAFVSEEIDKLNRGIKKEIGFQSESDDITLDITLEDCFIQFDYWDESINDYIKGEGKLGFELVINEVNYYIYSGDLK